MAELWGYGPTKDLQIPFISNYIKQPYTIQVIREHDGGWIASVLEFPGCITSADTWEELLPMIEDAMRCWLSVCIEDDCTIPLPELA